MSNAEYIALLEARTERQRLLLDVALEVVTELGYDLEELVAAAGIDMDTED